MADIDFNDIYLRPPNFCNDCGDLLDFEIILNENIICSKCGGSLELKTITEHSVITKDVYLNSKEWKNKLDNKEDKLKISQKIIRPTVFIKYLLYIYYILKQVNIDCPKCKAKKMYFYSLQTRSADEGATDYYDCTKCDYKFSINN